MIDPTPKSSRARAALALLFAFALAAAATAASAGADRIRTTASTGLHTLHPGHDVQVQLVEVGGEGVEPTAVLLRLLDRRDRVLREFRGELRPGHPLRLRLPGPSSHPLAFRAEATLVTSAGNFGTAPVLTVEVVRRDTGDAFTTSSCPVPYDPEGTGGKVLGNCGECRILVEAIP